MMSSQDAGSLKTQKDPQALYVPEIDMLLSLQTEQSERIVVSVTMNF